MSKIMILANNDIGLYKFRKELIQTLIDQNNEIVISLPDGPNIQPLIDMGCKFINTDINRRGINPIVDFGLLLKYFKIMKSNKPDYVITYTIKPNIYGGVASRLSRVPYAINITGLGTAFQKNNLLKGIIVFLYRFACSKAKVVFFENQENRDVFVQHKIIPEDQSCVLNGAGVNLKEFSFCEYPSDKERIHFLFIGRIMKEKGVNELFEAAERIHGENEDILFDIVGPYEDDCKDRIDELSAKGIIDYHGYQQDVRALISRSHCLLLPSYHEGMANTLLEAGAMGRPLITSDIPGCREAVVKEESGFLVRPKDSSDLYDKIMNFVNLPYEQRKRMGEKSHQHIKATFDKNEVIRKTLSHLSGNEDKRKK